MSTGSNDSTQILPKLSPNPHETARKPFQKTRPKKQARLTTYWVPEGGGTWSGSLLGVWYKSKVSILLEGSGVPAKAYPKSTRKSKENCKMGRERSAEVQTGPK